MGSLNSYHDFLRGLSAKGWQKLGCGSYSSVFCYRDRDYVLKVGSGRDNWLDYIHWAARQGFAGTFAPRVFKVKMLADGYVAKVEKLVPMSHHHRFADLCQALSFNIGPQSPELFKLDIAYPGIRCFLRQAMLAAATRDFPDYPPRSYLCDTRACNWLIRRKPDGRECIVLNDPLHWRECFPQEAKRWHPAVALRGE